MKYKSLILFFVTLAVLALAINAASAVVVCSPTIQLVSQDPTPAIPNDYVKLVFEVSGLDNPYCTGMSVKLVPEYPFSLDSGVNPTQTISGSLSAVSDYSQTWIVPYKLRVASDALEGDYKLKMLSKMGVTEDFDSSFKETDFNLTLTDVQTDFAAVVQDALGSQVSIGVVNTGKNTANSLIVSIPQQDNFRATGTSQQIVGNLAAGDYTIVSFSISSTASMPQRNSTRVSQQNFNRSSFNSTGLSGVPVLKVQFDYTDGVGKRRTVVKDVSAGALLSASGNSSRGGAFARSSTTSSSGSSTGKIILLIFLVVVAVFIYIKYGDKIKDYFKEKKHSRSSEKTPEWVSAERAHKRK